MQPKYYVQLRILDDKVLPKQITEESGVAPSRIWHKGDVRPRTRACIKEQENGWELDSSLAKEKSLAEHICFLLSVIKPVYVQFQNCTQKYYSQLSCAIYFEEERPVLSLDKNVIKQLADLNLNLDIDIYSVER